MNASIPTCFSWNFTGPVTLGFVLLASFSVTRDAPADGLVRAPALYRGVPYEGSVEEKSQEAIIIFHSARKAGEATEDLILRISLAGEVENFAWVVPFPNEPKVARADPKLFDELYTYVEARLAESFAKPKVGAKNEAAGDTLLGFDEEPVEVLSRRTVGTYDVAVVRENVAGALNDWLEEEGYQQIEDGEDVTDFYRKKGYVFACIKVDDAQLRADTTADLHPLRFSFLTGGRDGIYFPMKLTGLQQQPFDVNLYVFYGAWINDRLNKFGYEHRGFRRKHRDWDTSRCEPNAGKTYSTPEQDPYLRNQAHRLTATKKLFQTLHPGEPYYLTNIQAHGLKPQDVRQWADDLWLFPYYVERNFVPYDVRDGGPASATWPHAAAPAPRSQRDDSRAVLAASGRVYGFGPLVALSLLVAAVVGLIGLIAIAVWLVRRRSGHSRISGTEPMT